MTQKLSDFPDAMKLVLAGRRMRRVDWNRPAYIEVRYLEGGQVYVAVVMKDGKIGPYPPSHCDMFGRDWVEA